MRSYCVQDKVLCLLNIQDRCQAEGCLIQEDRRRYRMPERGGARESKGRKEVVERDTLPPRF